MKKLVTAAAMAALCAGGALADNDAMETRLFPVLGNWVEKVCEAQPGGDGLDATALKGFLELFGVTWPKGSDASYVQALGKIRVANTVANLEKVSDALKKTGAQPTLIELQVLVLSVSEETLKESGFYGPKRLASDKLLERLMAGKDTKVLGAPSVVSKSGDECYAKAVKECSYPKQYNVMVTPVADEKAAQRDTQLAAAEPCDFCTRDCGISVKANSTWNPELNLINMAMTCEVVGEPEWTGHGAVYAAGRVVDFNLKQPTFNVLASVEANLVVKPGTTMSFTGGKLLSGDGQVFVFVTPRLVGIDGQPF